VALEEASFALSPYLFIMSMDVLSRTLCRSLEEGSLRGIVLAPGAPPLTLIAYTDDLVLFGRADREEARNIAKIMEHFANLSGLRINGDKSVIWFSREGTYKKAEVLQFLRAKDPDHILDTLCLRELLSVSIMSLC
jgi:Reverse transcriptase (RNA-dependent DNA polymerase)